MVETAPSYEGAPGKRTSGRAGRNLPVATAVGVGLAAVVSVPLFSPARWLFVGVLMLATGVGIYEMVSALRTAGAMAPMPPLVVGGVGTVAAAYALGADALVLGLLLTVLGCLLWRLTGPTGGLLRDVSAAALTATYVPFLMGFAALLAMPPDGPRRVTALIVTVVCSDVGGYAAGVLFGRHLMAPAVSPKKSWEGFAGSATACAVAGAVLFPVLFGAPVVLGVLFGLAIVLTATVGDLGESLVKRDILVKDMGTLLPGHGGMMDRLDSLLPSAAVAYLLLSALVPVP